MGGPGGPPSGPPFILLLGGAGRGHKIFGGGSMGGPSGFDGGSWGGQKFLSPQIDLEICNGNFFYKSSFRDPIGPVSCKNQLSTK